ncbi:MAG TPA: aminotransferase class I/II-fold pyridoxal phosphate-dependent enzyme [Pyrinomonadaceae bacterium]|nr:aminotransferase class I/II-fold pyridoxal phosphate-dependent enzyme [Pyrinomonadaceae bacterium]
MSHNTSATSQRQYVELRTGTPYANLLASQRLFVVALGDYFDVSPDACIPTAGATGGIEAVRNHVFRTRLKASPAVLTACPDYWRARESFAGFGFEVIDVHTEPFGFAIAEAMLVAKAKETKPDLLYLSLPNNPTGAIFDPELVIAGVPADTAIIIDLTLPSRAIDVRVLTRELYRKFRGRENLFLVGSTSKSHGTAECRIGWVVCAGSDAALQLKNENRNVVACASITEAMKQLERGPTAIDLIESSFALLRNGEKEGAFAIVTPERNTETGYVLIRARVDAENLRSVLERRGIRVMWGSEFGLSDQYIRLETLEPQNIAVFVETVNDARAY